MNLEISKQTLMNRNNKAREVVRMNLMSSIMIKDHDIKNTTTDSKRTNSNHDHGYNLYKKLEFSRKNSNNISHNLQMEMICSRLV